jgi:N,N'-diacetyllegionaminate synthase
VAAAIDAVEATGLEDIALLHCVSNYPADPDDSNLNAMATMRAAFGVPTGWSDHMGDSATAVTAVAMGASLLEKHLTLDRHMPGPDHAASIEPDEFGAMVNSIRAVERARGSGVKVPVPTEISTAAVARRSLHWAASLGKGTVVRPEHLVALRPGTGLQPSFANQLGGLLLRQDVTEGAMVIPADVGLRADEEVHS